VHLAELREIVNDVKFNDWKFVTGVMDHGYFIQVKFLAPDNETHKIALQSCRKWYVSSFATRSEVVQTAFLAAKQATEHEMREQFLYKGKAIFGPHIDVDARLTLADNRVYREKLTIDEAQAV
jgi:hypothetical protein